MTEAEILLAQYVVALLETIACNGRGGNLEVEDYLGRIQNACGITAATELFQRLRARPETHEREMSLPNDSQPNARLRGRPRKEQTV
jgi:hypothetical protein